MKREIQPVKNLGGVIRLPGDKSIAHRAALLSILCQNPVHVKNYPDSTDCRASLEAARAFGVTIDKNDDGTLTLRPPEKIVIEPETIIDCGNSGTTARLFSGLTAGLPVQAIIAGDGSLTARPMKRIVDPLKEMGAELFDTEGHLPLKINGRKLLPFEYRLPVPSAQVKSALLLAGLASECTVTLREEVITRDHTERMISELGGGIDVREVKPVRQTDPQDPRKKRMVMPEPFKKEIVLRWNNRLVGGSIEIPGDFSTAAFFFGAAAIAGSTVTVEQVGLNSTRTAFLEHLKNIGCTVEIADREVISGEPRGTVTVTGGELKPRKISGEMSTRLIDELPILAVIAAYAPGTTIIRDATELKYKESDRLVAIAHNLEKMGVSCGVLEDGLVIERKAEPNGADFKSFGDHRIAMAFSMAALFAVGPSTIDDDSATAVSCPDFFELLSKISG